MKHIKINDDIILIDEFLNYDDLSLIENEIKSLGSKLIEYDGLEGTGFKDTTYHRLFLDDEYYNNRNSSQILKVINKTLFDDGLKKIINNNESYPFSTYFKTDRHETQLTIYGNGGKYNWHQDNDQHRILSYVLPVNPYGKQWTGGELIIKHSNKEIKIEPKENQLILFSSHLWHKVLPIKTDDDILHGRVVVNGHIGFKL